MILATVMSIVSTAQPLAAPSNPFMPGDATDDRVVDIDDVNAVINHMVHKGELTGKCLANADCNRDGVIDIDDLNLVINRMVRKGFAHSEPMSLVVELRDGERRVFPLADEPQLTIEGDELKVTSNAETAYCNRSELFKLYYTTSTLARGMKRVQRPPIADNPNQFAIYVYRNDDRFEGRLNVDIESIRFSAVGTDSLWYDNALVQEVWTPDTVFRTPVAVIDSVTFQAPDPVFKHGLFVITEEHLPYMTTATDSTLTFTSSAPAVMLPVQGQVVYSELDTEWFTMGFAGRVVAVKQNGATVTYECEPVSPRDVYDRLVTVGKIEATGNDEQGAPRRIADDGVIHSPKIKIEVEYEEYLKLKGSASMTIDYAFNFGWGGKDFANVTITDELEVSLSVSLKSSLGKSQHEMLLPIPVAYVGNKVLGASVSVGLFFDMSGSVSLSTKIPYRIKHVEEYKWSSDDFFHIDYEKYSDGGWGDVFDGIESTFKVKGEAKFGPVVKTSLMIWKPKFLSINAALKGGPQIEASLEFDFTDPESYRKYDVLAKDTKLSTGMYLGVDVTAQTWKKEYDVATIGTTLFERESYLFPRFTTPEFPKLLKSDPVKWEDGLNPMAVYTVPSNNLWLPGKVGIGLYDDEGNEIGKHYYNNWYFGGSEHDWSKNWLQYNLADDLVPGKVYMVRPLFKLLNVMEVEGTPKYQFLAPQHLGFESETIDLPAGTTEYLLPIQGGWGLFNVANTQPSIVEAQIYEAGETRYLQLNALKEGTAELTVTDLRTGQTASVGVTVKDPNAEKTFEANGVKFTMVNVKGGTFTMGATAEQGDDYRDNEKPTHRVTLSNYSIGMTEVTQELWVAVMGFNPSFFNNYGNADYESEHGFDSGVNLKRPVESVSWDDCQTFIAKLNQLTGQNFRLPTEAEWEYAARGGVKRQGHKFAGSDDVEEVAWSTASDPDEYGAQTVALKLPNELGLYDMSGNVWEWCQDWLSNYTAMPQTNPKGPNSGSARVVRGGCWVDLSQYCRVSMRHGWTPDKRMFNVGLRLAM